MTNHCLRCQTPLHPAAASCPRCGWYRGPVVAEFADDQLAAPEQGMDTIYIGAGLLGLGAMIFVGGMGGLLYTLRTGGFDAMSLDFFVTASAIVAGVTIALFIASAVLFAVGKGPTGARAAGAAGAVMAGVLSTVASVLVAIAVVIIVILAVFFAIVASIMETCGCKPANSPARQGGAVNVGEP